MARQKKRADGRLQRGFTFNGKRYYVYGRTSAELEEKKDELKARLKAGKESHDNPTFDQYYEDWKKARNGKVSGSTVRHHDQIKKACSEIVISKVNKRFGLLKLSEIQSRDILELQTYLLETKGYTTNAVNQYIGSIKLILKAAVEEGLLDRNPCRNVKPLKRTEERARDTKHRALTQAETKAFFKAASDSYYLDVFKMAIYTGMRIGEIGALYSSDIKDGMITIERTITTDENGFSVIGDSAKTAAGRRTIALNDDIRQTINHQRMINQMIEGDAVVNIHDRIFKAPGRGLLNTSRVNAEIAKICGLAKIEPFTMHAFRDTFATRAIEQGIDPKTLQEILGHADFSITMNLYGHVLDDTKKEAMQKIVIAV